MPAAGRLLGSWLVAEPIAVALASPGPFGGGVPPLKCHEMSRFVTDSGSGP